MKKFLIACSALALAACGSERTGTFQTEDGEVQYSMGGSGDQGTFSLKTDEGEFTMQTGSGNVDLPAGFTRYPGSTVVSNITMNSPEGSNSTVTMNAGDAVDKVVAFYRRQAEAAGVKISMEMKSNDVVMVGGESENGLVFSINASPDDEGGTIANLSLSQKKGG